MLIAVNYHYVRPAFDAPYPGIHGITPAQFEAQLRLLGQMGTFVSASDLTAALDGTRALPERALIVTFDDGLREQYDHAWPVLQKLGVPAVFFINTAPIASATVSTVHKIHLLRAHTDPAAFGAMVVAAAAERGVEVDPVATEAEAIAHYKYDTLEAARLKYVLNFVLDDATVGTLMDAAFAERFGESEAAMSRALYMTREQVGALAAAGCIGSHAHEHVPLGLMPPTERAAQIADASDLLEAWTGRRPEGLSYPYGSEAASSYETGRDAARAGIRFAFTMERAANPDLAAPLFLARYDNNDMPGGKAARGTAASFFETAALRRWPDAHPSLLPA